MKNYIITGLELKNYYKSNYNIMSNETIRHLWQDFINEYKNYFK